MSEWRLFAGDVAVLLGIAALTLTVSALLRMPDPVVQIHATAKGVILGVLAVMLASVFTASAPVVLEALLVGAFVLPASAAASHALIHLERIENGAVDDGDDASRAPGYGDPGPDAGG